MKVTKVVGETIQFVCPKCGGNTLEEVLTNAYVETPITFNRDGHRHTGMRIIYGVSRCVEGEIQCYQCSGCGFTPEDKDGSAICDDSALEEWMNNPVGIEKILDENDAADLNIPRG